MISVKTPTFRNIDHSSTKTIVGSLANTYTQPTGSQENQELILSQIYKEICAKEPKIEVTIPEIKIPPIYMPNIDLPHLDQPTIENKVEVNPTPVTVQVNISNLLLYLNLTLSIIALGIAIASYGK